MKVLNKHAHQASIMKAVLTVKEKQYLSPHYIRIILEGDEVVQFSEAKLGDNNKIIVPAEKGASIHLPDSPSELRHPVNGQAPIIRTYTLRALDLLNKTMTVDFVVHGDEGPASAWAINAETGDELGVLMKTKDKELLRPADWYFLTGDHTALPVISVMLESLPADAEGMVVIEVYSEEDKIHLIKPAKVDIIWTYNDQPGKVSTLKTYFERLELFPDSSKFIFVAAEYAAVAEIQDLLRREENLERHEWQSYSYWKYGAAEDDSASKRKGLTHRG